MMDANKHLMDIVPYRLGSRVRVVRSHRYASEWPDIYVVTGMRWEYQIGPWINIELAEDRDIENGSPAADGWHVEDLEPAELTNREAGG